MSAREIYEDYLELDFKEVISESQVSRREFLKIAGAAGAGLFLFFTFGPTHAEAQEGGYEGVVDRSIPATFNAYLRIAPDGQVFCFTGKIEMGQGIITSLSQMLADELDVSIESVKMVMGDTDVCPWDMGTFGSMSIRFFGPTLREAGAEARQVLLEMGSEHLNIPIRQLNVENGVIIYKSDRSRRVSYGQLVNGKKIKRQLERRAAVKKPSEFKIIGQPFTRRDAHGKVTGEAKYAGDIQLPGMVYGKILRPPGHGAKLIDVDTSRAERIAGVQIVRDRDFVAVVHKYPDVAEKALKEIEATFDEPAGSVNETTIFDHLLKVAPAGTVVRQNGNLGSGKRSSDALFQETYLDGYVAHAPMETHTAVVSVEAGKAKVWASTQTPFAAKDAAARTLRVPRKNVQVITPFVGGGFGGKTNTQHVVEAARLAKLAGKPVQLVWSREEEFFYDTFRPAAVVKIQSGLAKTGKVKMWDYSVYFAGERGSQHFYAIPHYRTAAHGSGWRSAPGTHPFATGAWRAPGCNTNTFARESQIDIMAAHAGIDPFDFRINNLQNKKMIRVLRSAADKFGWRSIKSPSGKGLGIACAIDAGTYVAAIVKVEVDRQTGHVQVERIVCAQDMGLVVNPEGAKIQIEGCVTMGLGYALTEEIHFQGGKIFDLNFDTYEIPRFSWLPKIETVLIDNQNSPAQGGGEPAITVMGGAIANAIYDAIGIRLFQMPMTPERIRDAM